MKLSSGAEAIIWKKEDTVVKERIEKDYRIPEIDLELRKTRTKKEAKIMQKLSEIGFPVPKIHAVDLKLMTIVMNFIEGKKLKECLKVDLCREIGQNVGKLHNLNVIHGDLTTSNMILKDKIYFIDFGLSATSTKIEDKAVDLHLLRQSLESGHHKIWESCFEEVLKGYGETNLEHEKILKRLTLVELRGRNKKKH